MARSNKVLIRCFGLVIALFVLMPAAGFAGRLDIEVTYSLTSGCPDTITVPDTEIKWRTGVFQMRPRVRWVEHDDVADDRAVWVFTWNPAKPRAAGKTEYPHLRATTTIEAREDASNQRRAIHAWAPNGDWHWTYNVEVTKPGCATKILDPEIIFTGGTGGGP